MIKSEPPEIQYNLAREDCLRTWSAGKVVKWYGIQGGGSIGAARQFSGPSVETTHRQIPTLLGWERFGEPVQ